jgi:hypothetical protein
LNLAHEAFINYILELSMGIHIQTTAYRQLRIQALRNLLRHWTEELCLEGQYPGVASTLLTLRLVFYEYYLIKLPVEDL